MKFKNEINNFFNGLNESKFEEVNEGKNDVGHYERVGNQTIVDSNFVNYSKGMLSGSELVHLGMGDFMLKTPKGDITFNRSGNLVGIGQDFVGRPHRMTDNKGGKVIDELIDQMTKKKKAILSMSESKVEESEEVNEGFTDQTGAKSAFFKQYPEAYDLFDDKMKKFVDKAKMYLSPKSIIFTDGRSGVQITKTAPFSIIKTIKNVPNNLDVLEESEVNENIFLKLESAIGDVLKNLNENENNSTEKQELLEQLSIMNRKLNDFHNSLID